MDPLTISRRALVCLMHWCASCAEPSRLQARASLGCLGSGPVCRCVAFPHAPCELTHSRTKQVAQEAYMEVEEAYIYAGG